MSEIGMFGFRTFGKLFGWQIVLNGIWNSNELKKIVRFSNTKPVPNRFKPFLFGYQTFGMNRTISNPTIFCSVCQTERTVFGHSLYQIISGILDNLNALFCICGKRLIPSPPSTERYRREWFLCFLFGWFRFSLLIKYSFKLIINKKLIDSRCPKTGIVQFLDTLKAKSSYVWNTDKKKYFLPASLDPFKLRKL